MCVCVCVCVCVYVCMYVCVCNSPMTLAVNWCLSMHNRFFTSQNKVVLTVSSTVRTINRFPSLRTVSGMGPDRLGGGGGRGRKRQGG